MTIFERLETDHQTVLQLVDELEASESSRSRERVFRRLKRELEMHTLFEEEVFYPMIADASAAAREEVDEAAEQHDDMTSILENMNEADKDSEDFQELLEQLGATLREHIEEEEGTLFEMGREVIPEETAIELAGKYELAREEFIKAA